MFDSIYDEKKYLIDLIKEKAKAGNFFVSLKNKEDFSLEAFEFLIDLGYTILTRQDGRIVIDWSISPRKKKKAGKR